MTTFELPQLSLVLLIGASGAGKSTFAAKHFRANEVLSSDFVRGMVRNDPNDQSASADAFEILHAIAGKRLAAGLLTVIDATNVQHAARQELIAVARAHHVLPVGIVFDLPRETLIARNALRPDRADSGRFVGRQQGDLRRGMKGPAGKGLTEEGLRKLLILRTPEEIDAVSLVRTPLFVDRRDERGPFDCIGDVHGCCDELEILLANLGHVLTDGRWGHPEGRRVIFLGDLVDRGPRSLDSVRLARAMVADGAAMCVQGNHDYKFLRALDGRDVQRRHGLERTMAEFEALDDAERARFIAENRPFLYGLTSHFVLDGGRLVVAHAGMKQAYQGRASSTVREFGLYGETSGETDVYGLPVRYNWAADYRGDAYVVYGHTPVVESEWLNRTICIDNGCVFGGKLTALRYPEMTLVSVPAARLYYEPMRPVAHVGGAGDGADVGALESDYRTAQQVMDDVLQLDEVIGKRTLTTRLQHTVTISADESATALEVMSRFSLDPRWLVYLPPTMSPTETSDVPHLLEHPAEAFEYYRKQAVESVVCEQKHMGSRAVVIVLRSPEVALRRFGVVGHTGLGVIYTRTGRAFFNDEAMAQALLERVRDAAEASGLFDRLETDWLCLDCELMPWSAKAQELLRRQYARVGAAGTSQLSDLVGALTSAAGRSADPQIAAWLENAQAREACVQGFVDAWRGYCWPVASVSDLKLAPFHLLAAEGHVFVERDHVWHMETLAELAAADASGVLMATPFRQVSLADDAAVADAIAWWETLTAAGGEGMVVKPLQFVTMGQRGPVQPAIKCRGREYLRIIYGPEYTLPQHLQRLRKRGVGGKRSLAMREFALGVESLERFVRHEPLRRVHECVFGVLALEADPIDPRL